MGIFTLNAAAVEDGYICVHGKHTFSDYHMNYGVGDYGNNRRYYWTSGFNSTYENYISDAVSEWVHTTPTPGVYTSISIRETTVRENAYFEFINKNVGEGIGGETHFYRYDTEIKLNSKGTLTQNYGWAKMYIGVSELNKAQMAPEQKQATIAHELGHAMGLSHQNTRSKSIMCQYLGGKRTATRADKTDLNTINHIYG